MLIRTGKNGSMYLVLRPARCGTVTQLLQHSALLLDTHSHHLLQSMRLCCSLLGYAWQLLRLCNAQPLKRLLKIIRQGRLQHQLLSSPRVINTHPRSMEQLSRRKRHLHNKDQSLASPFTCACCLTTTKGTSCELNMPSSRRPRPR